MVGCLPRVSPVLCPESPGIDPRLPTIGYTAQKMIELMDDWSNGVIYYYYGSNSDRHLYCGHYMLLYFSRFSVKRFILHFQKESVVSVVIKCQS